MAHSPHSLRASRALIVGGYLCCFLGGVLGVLIALHIAVKYPKSMDHALIMFLVGTMIGVISFALYKFS